MATIKGKPPGWFQYLLAIDCETTGLCFNSNDPSYDPNTGERHQTVSWGIIVADAETLKPVEELYVEVKWNEHSIKQRESDPQFGKRAEGIHGLSYSHLEQNGFSEEDVVVAIGGLIMKYWGPEVSIRTLGHNVHTFDMPFLRDMFARQDVHLKFGNRHYDTNSIGFATFGTFNSDELFKQCGFEERGTHNALDDAHMALGSARVIKTAFQACING